MHDDTQGVTGGSDVPQGDESVESLRRRITELEAALGRMTHQREETRRMLFVLYDQMFPDDPPPTEEELIEERKTLSEKTISEMISELEQQAGSP